MLHYNLIVDEIKKYCMENKINYDSLMLNSVKGCDNSSIIFCEISKEECEDGLLNEKPMPILLIVRKDNDGLTFEQTEHTKKYLK